MPILRSEPALKFRRPMLAKGFESNQHKIIYPCFIQPKVDGVRVITDGQRFWSRNGKLFPADNFAHLRVTRFPCLLDGEITLSVDGDFEEIVSVVKRAGHALSPQLRINVFDCMTGDPYGQRFTTLRRVFEHYHSAFGGRWHRLITHTADTLNELAAWNEHFLDRGYEGSIVRNAHGHYVSQRSDDLLKWKPLHDDEFEIIDVVEAKGKDAGTPIFVCDSPGGPFRARPMGSMKARRQMWRDRKKLIGKPLTVEYQNLTKYGKPRFPRAKVLRDYE